MPGNSFINFGIEVKGESRQEGYPGTNGWIEIGDWNWDIESESSFDKGSGSSSGKATPGVFGFSHFYDRASPVIMTRLVQGKHFPLVTVETLKQTGDDKPKPFMRVVIEEAFISKVSSKGGDDGAVSQDIEMVFKKISLHYKAQDNLGALESSVKTFGWIVDENTTEYTKNSL